MKKLFAVVLAVIMVVSLAACGLKAPSSNTSTSTPDTQEKIVESTSADDDFVLDAGDFDITVPEGYHLANELLPAESDVKVMITDKSNNVGLMFVQEPLSDFEGSDISSLDDYIKLQHDNINGENASEIKEINGMKYFTYTFHNKDLGYTYEYFTTATKTDTDFWAMQGFTLQNMYDDYEADFAKWLSSVKFH